MLTGQHAVLGRAATWNGFTSLTSSNKLLSASGGKGQVCLELGGHMVFLETMSALCSCAGEPDSYGLLPHLWT